MSKSVNAFRTISEVAEWLGIPTHVLRFWESKFSQIKPIKRAGGRRYYRPKDMLLIGGIKQLLHEDGLTIKGAQKVLREHGAKHVCSLSPTLGLEEPFSEPVAAKRSISSEDNEADWQPMQISDFAIDISEETKTDFSEISDKNNVHKELSPHTHSASPSKSNEKSESHGSNFGDARAAKQLGHSPIPVVESREAVNEIERNTPIKEDSLEEFNKEKKLNEKSKVIEKGEDNYNKPKPFFDGDQSEFNLGLDEKESNIAELKVPQEPVSSSLLLVKPTFDEIMAYLRSGHNIDNNTRTLINHIFVNLENQLIQRRSGNFK